VSISPCPIQNCRSKDVDGNPILIHTPVCDRCANRVRSVLVNAETIHRDAGLAMAPVAGGAGGERVSTGETIRLPINGDALALQQDLARVLAYAAEDLLGYRTVSRVRNQDLYHVARLILDRFDEALQLPGFPADAIDLARRADRLLGTTAPPVKLHAPCSACGCLGLCREAGSELVECRACGVVYDPHAYAELVADVLAVAA
jgi:hypothetical protein